MFNNYKWCLNRFLIYDKIIQFSNRYTFVHLYVYSFVRLFVYTFVRHTLYLLLSFLYMLLYVCM